MYFFELATQLITFEHQYQPLQKTIILLDNNNQVTFLERNIVVSPARDGCCSVPDEDGVNSVAHGNPVAIENCAWQERRFEFPLG